MTDIRDLHRKWMKEPAYRSAYDDLEAEFELARTLIEVRSRIGLTQEELAGRMNMPQSVLARMEGGRMRPSTKTLQRFAMATGTRLRINFES
uniref:Transcriptional regulator, XRE family n=1 Tax=Candidatus Kentrum sp. LPFa TaxID=2126335 RepID=A0A450XXQ9_9GAMM|nr:MAG: transcriptional regulator, XRE family [Candidatus Kentron sp. LPFa]VFK34046.1 MAG: transcriptional regulator, XRE family [Candidatus Kentron sp. LPFa]